MPVRFDTTEDQWICSIYNGEPITTEPPTELRDVITDVLRRAMIDDGVKRRAILNHLNDIMHFSGSAYINAIVTGHLKYMESIRHMVESPEMTKEEIDGLINGLTINRIRLAFDILRLLGFNLDHALRADIITAKSSAITKVDIVAKSAELDEFIRNNLVALKILLCKTSRQILAPRLDYNSIKVFVNDVLSETGWRLTTLGVRKGPRRDEVILTTFEYIKWNTVLQKHTYL